MKSFFRTLFNLAFDIRRASEIRRDPERKSKSVRFGILAIVLAIIAVPFSLLMFPTFNVIASGGGLFTLIIAIILGLLGVALPVVLLLDSLFYMILQLSINRKAMTWIALVVVVGALIAVGVIAYMAVSGAHA